jgi:hypothetical protein
MLPLAAHPTFTQGSASALRAPPQGLELCVVGEFAIDNTP